MDKVLDILRGFFQAIREINEKYKTPQIKMTPMVSASLLILRLYLLATVAILLVKFIMVTLGH
ncbi:MAG TPA: hypothetical protein VIN60_02105 [Anaerolineales bacterium]